MAKVEYDSIECWHCEEINKWRKDMPPPVLCFNCTSPLYRLVHPKPRTSDGVERMENPKDQIGAKKIPLTLVPKIGIAQTALAMKDGANKYDPYNWREKQVKMTVYIEAARRHLDLLELGEDAADDSKCLHAAHASACMNIIMDAQFSGNLIDDRYKDEKLIEAYKLLNDFVVGTEEGEE